MLFGGVTKKDCVTLVAVAYELFPGCDALTVTLPHPFKTRMFPLKVAGPDTIEKLTGRPESAVALSGRRVFESMTSVAD